MHISTRTSVILIWVTALTLALVGCAEKIMAPRDMKAQVKINLSAAEGPIDHGWLTIDNNVENRHRMDFVADVLQSEPVSVLPGAHVFDVVAVDAEEVVLMLGVLADTISSEADTVTLTIPLIPAAPECIISRGLTDFGEVNVGESVADTLILANAATATGALRGSISLDSEHFSLVSGGGAYDLAPGEQHVVVVGFNPQTGGALSATVATGSDCGDVVYTGTGLGAGGTVVVNPEPNEANARWSLVGPSGFELVASGDRTLTDLEPGSYTLTWGATPGWDRPSLVTQAQDLVSDGTITFTGVFVQNFGSITINPEPGAIFAPWSLVGPGGLSVSAAGDSTLTNMAAGDYTITWGDLPRWIAPELRTETKTKGLGASITFTATYLPLLGAATINPDPDTINAPWRLRGPNSFDQTGSGDTVIADLEPGNYNLDWLPVAGWASPDPAFEFLELLGGDSITFNGSYVALPGMVVVEPQPFASEGQWTLTGPNDFQLASSGWDTLSAMEPGSYTIVWSDSPGWQAPVANTETQELSGGGSIVFAATFTEKPGTITIDPNTGEQVALWTLVGPDTFIAGAGFRELPDMPPGLYTLTWGVADGWELPSLDSEQAELLPGGELSFLGDYTSLLGTINVEPVPAEAVAPWQLDGPDGSVLFGSGTAQLKDMVPGGYTLTWLDKPNWFTPVPYFSTQTLRDNGLLTFPGVYVECLATAGFYPSSNDVMGVAIQNNLAYLANGSAGLTVVDISDPALPVEYGSYADLGYARAVAVDDAGFIYVANDFQVSQFEEVEPGLFQNIATEYSNLEGSEPVALQTGFLGSTPYLFVAWRDEGVAVLYTTGDVGSAKDAAYMYRDASFRRQDSAEALGLDFVDDLLYVAYGDAGLVILDVFYGEGVSLSLLGEINTSGTANDVAVVGNVAYVAGGSGGLQVINVVDRTNPLFSKALTLGTNTVSVEYTGQYLLVTDETTGVHAIDISDPLDPVAVNSRGITGTPGDIFFGGEISAVAAGTGGLRLLKTPCYGP